MGWCVHGSVLFGFFLLLSLVLGALVEGFLLAVEGVVVGHEGLHDGLVGVGLWVGKELLLKGWAKAQLGLRHFSLYLQDSCS